jgi:hypothetical protein
MYTVLQRRALTQAVGFRHFENPLFPQFLHDDVFYIVVFIGYAC